MVFWCRFTSRLGADGLCSGTVGYGDTNGSYCNNNRQPAILGHIVSIRQLGLAVLWFHRPSPPWFVLLTHYDYVLILYRRVVCSLHLLRLVSTMLTPMPSPFCARP